VPTRRILIIDDDPAIRRTLRMTLAAEGYEVLDAASGAEGIQKVVTDSPEAILLDIKMPILDGLEVLEDIRRRLPRVPVIMISGHADIRTAMEAVQKGANDVWEKPLDSEVLLLRLAQLFEQQELRSENTVLRDQERRRREEEATRFKMVGDSAAVRRLQEAIARAAPTPATVLITGESGSGKELLARAIHAGSQRASRPFIRVNCAAIPEELIESELFGHERGSFTGATTKQIGKFVQADGGTIFLDEVGDMSPRTQAKVLRVLQEGEVEPVGAAEVFRVDVRVIAATNKDLGQEIRKGTFREDLFFRLNVIPIQCPPLRDRSDDIPVLVEHFVRQFQEENQFKARRIAPEAMAALARHSWPGNIRELRTVVLRMLIMGDGDPITDVPLSPPAAETSDGVPLDRYATLKEFKEAAERAFLVRKLERNDWNISQTAKEIDTPRSNLYKKLEQYGLAKDRNGAEDAPEDEGDDLA
jgi:two-component system nitrogen regulation response regulator NtrX